jgi:hypothetical protein
MQTTPAGWRDEILREFTPGVARLTVVDDPDGLFSEAGIVEALPASDRGRRSVGRGSTRTW